MTRAIFPVWRDMDATKDDDTRRTFPVALTRDETGVVDAKSDRKNDPTLVRVAAGEVAASAGFPTDRTAVFVGVDVARNTFPVWFARLAAGEVAASRDLKKEPTLDKDAAGDEEASAGFPTDRVSVFVGVVAASAGFPVCRARDASKDEVIVRLFETVRVIVLVGVVVALASFPVWRTRAKATDDEASASFPVWRVRAFVGVDVARAIFPVDDVRVAGGVVVAVTAT